MLRILVITLLSSLIFTSWAQDIRGSIVFYNVENLFDTLDTENKNDEEFLPNGKKEWNADKYNTKLEHINKVFNEFNHPLIMGVCEIENKSVVRDIVNYGKLKGLYGVVHTESLDKRGIDNAIIYDSTLLTLVESGIVRFDMPEGFSPSRDIVWAKFSQGKDSMYVMVNHWPSRYGGQIKSEPKRLVAATAAAEFIDSLQLINKKVKIVFMGDLNDYPGNIAPEMISERLTPMITNESGEYGGTHSYHGEWGVLDHIMVSSSLLKRRGIIAEKKTGTIHNFKYLMTIYKGNTVPFRTYGGGKYLDGYSDHLPVSIKIWF